MGSGSTYLVRYLRFVPYLAYTYLRGDGQSYHGKGKVRALGPGPNRGQARRQGGLGGLSMKSYGARPELGLAGGGDSGSRKEVSRV